MHFAKTLLGTKTSLICNFQPNTPVQIDTLIITF